MDLIKKHKWSVSCSYDILKADDKGGSENNIKYGMEILDGEFKHLAIVKNPRYERANIVFNSKTVIVNDAEFESKHPRDEQGRFAETSYSKYFLDTTTGMSMYDDVLKDEHYAETKQRFPKIVKMSPDKYIETVLDGFNSAYKKYGNEEYIKTKEQLIKSRETGLDKLREKFGKVQLDMPIISYEMQEDKSLDMGAQEGLHRAILAKEQGLSEIPVAIYTTARYGAKIPNEELKEALANITAQFENISDKDKKEIKENKYIYTMHELLKKYNYSNEVFFKNKIEEIPDSDKKQIEKYKEIVTDIFDRHNKNKSIDDIDIINLGYTPQKLQEAGLSNIKMKVDPGVITKAINEKNTGHSLAEETIKSIPELIHNPIVVMKSISSGHEEDSVVVITEAADNDGNNVIVPIRLNVNENAKDPHRKEYYINEIMSIHGRSNLEYVFGKTFVTPQGIKKIDKNKMQMLLKLTSRLQDVAVVTPADYNIPPSDTNLNPNVKNNKETFEDAFKNSLSEIIKNCKPETKEDLKILKGLKDILEEQ